MDEKPEGTVGEPLQKHTAADGRLLLDRLSQQTGPVQSLMNTLRDEPFPTDIAEQQDGHLAEAYTDTHVLTRRRRGEPEP